MHPTLPSILVQPHDYSINNQKGIAICEVQGPRDSQQDTIFVAELTDESAIQNPEEFFKRHIANNVFGHAFFQNGTTFCSAIVLPATPGNFLPTIQIANLGDSAAILHLQLFDPVSREERDVTLLLTEPHSLDIPRVQNAIRANGGEIARDAEGELRIRDTTGHPSVNVGGAIGDSSLKGNMERDAAAGIDKNVSPQLHIPDVWLFDPNSLLNSFSGMQLLDANLILCCDGLIDLEAAKFPLQTNYEARTNEDGSTILQAVTADASRLQASSIIAECRDPNFLAEHLVRKALQHRSLDNISVANISLKNLNKPLIAAICDGHGLGNYQLGSDGLAPESADGFVVSSSVAADLYVATRARELVGLPLQNDYFKYFVKSRGGEIGVVNAEEQDWVEIAEEKSKSEEEIDAEYEIVDDAMPSTSVTPYRQRPRSRALSDEIEHVFSFVRNNPTLASVVNNIGRTVNSITGGRK